MDEVVVVGGGLAAVHAIQGLRDFGYERGITLVGAEPMLPYDRPPLSKEALRDGPDPERSLLRDPSWYENSGVTLQLGAPALGVDGKRRLVSLGEGREVRYDGLVIATGSTARTLESLGHQESGARSLRTMRDAVTLHDQLKAARSLAVVGGGFIGLEVAATAREMGLHVDVIEIAPVLLSRVLGDEVGQWFREYHERRGVRIHCGTSVEEIESGPDTSKLRLGNGTVLSADLVVTGIGAVPAVGWLRDGPVRLAGGVVCDEYLQTGVEGVVAAGDVAQWYNPLFDETMRVEQWSNAVSQGRHAAGALLGAREPCTVVPYFWSDQFDARMRFVGRSTAASQVEIVESSQDKLVALFGRDGAIRGALCVNAPKQLVRYRSAIEARIPWPDVV
ncbi:NAD(P)/FAD-dependent oxidoreductase [Amycolatopsis jejuensis]|uniref:NAD(P)/FAD-dependent oxidoreductase n=1 Tax=Amycolatopsis jejuensis TaxID=330084 RepID=UPI000526A1B6|nr:FAD-dependent oxidoreductase [Amycolatopsis jejuensis]